MAAGSPGYIITIIAATDQGVRKNLTYPFFGFAFKYEIYSYRT